MFDICIDSCLLRVDTNLYGVVNTSVLVSVTCIPRSQKQETGVSSWKSTNLLTGTRMLSRRAAEGLISVRGSSPRDGLSE